MPPFINELVQWGAGPRASIYLILAGKARAILHGRVHVTTEDIAEVAHPGPATPHPDDFSAEAAGMNSDKIIERCSKRSRATKPKRREWKAVGRGQ